MLSRNDKGQYIQRQGGKRYKSYSIYYDNKGYAIIYINGKDIKLHVFVWEEANGEKPKGYQIHHLDGNKANYNLKNLLPVNQSDHFRIHAGWVKTNGKWTHKPCNRCKKIMTLDKFYPRKGLPPTALCKPCHNEAIKERDVAHAIQKT